MVFGSNARPMTATVQSQNPKDIQWGSDSNFGRNESFLPLSEKETSEHLLNERMAYMGCLEVSTSAATTRPSSPTHNGETSPLKLKTRGPPPALVKQENDGDEPPRKRRKSKSRDEEEEEDEEPLSASVTGKASIRKRKSKLDAAGVSPVSTDAPGKRRKSAVGPASKQPRENLSETQKRENHIKSEQKRRTVIKEGFDDLCDLVPGLKGGGFSKSAMLTMAAEWLEELMQGNSQLRLQLAGVEGK